MYKLQSTLHQIFIAKYHLTCCSDSKFHKDMILPTEAYGTIFMTLRKEHSELSESYDTKSIINIIFEFLKFNGVNIAKPWHKKKLQSQ